MSYLVNNEGKNMDNITNAPIETTAPAVPLTDEELALLLAKPTFVTTDEAEETDEQKVTLN